MASWKKIHEWVVKALEEPFLRAELHRAEICLPEKKEPHLQVVKTGMDAPKGFHKSVQAGGGAR